MAIYLGVYTASPRRRTAVKALELAHLERKSALGGDWYGLWKKSEKGAQEGKLATKAKLFLLN